jgi:hypothetical protein
MSYPLGDTVPKTEPTSQGLQVHMPKSRASLSQVWREWVLIQGAYPYVGLPRRRPMALRRWLERYALLIAVFGICMALCAIVLAFTSIK